MPVDRTLNRLDLLSHQHILLILYNNIRLECLVIVFLLDYYSNLQVEQFTFANGTSRRAQFYSGQPRLSVLPMSAAMSYRWKPAQSIGRPKKRGFFLCGCGTIHTGPSWATREIHTASSTAVGPRNPHKLSLPVGLVIEFTLVTFV